MYSQRQRRLSSRSLARTVRFVFFSVAWFLALTLTVHGQGIIIINPGGGGGVPPPPPVPTATPPPNDNFADAIPLPSVVLGYSVSYSTAGATRETGETNTFTDYPRPSVWWKWTPTHSAPTWIDCNQSDMAVYTGDSVTNLQLVALGYARHIIIFAWGGEEVGGRFDFTNDFNTTYWIADLSSSSHTTSNTFAIGQKLHWADVTNGLVGKPYAFTLRGADDIPLPTELHATIGIMGDSGPPKYQTIWTTVRDETITAPTKEFLDWIPSETGNYRLTLTAQYATGESWTREDNFAIDVGNDLFADAIEIPADFTTGVFPLRTDLASFEPGEPSLNSRSLGHTVWWRWTPDHDANLRLRAPHATTQGMLLEVFTGPSLTSLIRIANNDWSALNPLWSGFTPFAAKAGTTYYIRVNDLDGRTAGSLLIEPFHAPAPGVILLSSIIYTLNNGATQWETFGKVYRPDGNLATNQCCGAFFVGHTLETLQSGPKMMIGSTYAFPQPPVSGTVTAGLMTFPGILAGDEVVVQLRAWDPPYDYAPARANGYATGRSQIIKVIAGSELTGPALLRGLGDLRMVQPSGAFNPGSLSIPGNNDSSFRLTGFNGIYAIDATDLANGWNLIGYVTNAVGAIEFQDPRPNKGPVNFYRTRLLD